MKRTQIRCRCFYDRCMVHMRKIKVSALKSSFARFCKTRQYPGLFMCNPCDWHGDFVPANACQMHILHIFLRSRCRDHPSRSCQSPLNRSKLENQSLPWTVEERGNSGHSLLIMFSRKNGCALAKKLRGCNIQILRLVTHTTLAGGEVG